MSLIFFRSLADVGDWGNDRPTLFESLLSVTYINSVTHGAFYFVDYTCRPVFTHFTLTLDGIEQLHSLSLKYLENISRLIFAARSPLSNSAKLINLW